MSLKLDWDAKVAQIGWKLLILEAIIDGAVFFGCYAFIDLFIGSWTGLTWFAIGSFPFVGGATPIAAWIHYIPKWLFGGLLMFYLVRKNTMGWLYQRVRKGRR